MQCTSTVSMYPCYCGDHQICGRTWLAKVYTVYSNLYFSVCYFVFCSNYWDVHCRQKKVLDMMEKNYRIHCSVAKIVSILY